MSLFLSKNEPHTNTQEDLAAARRAYKENFKPGCSLESPTTLELAGGVTLSATFAKCKPGFPQKTYKAGRWEGGNAVIETDQSTKKELAVIIVYGKISDVSSSTIVNQKLMDAHRYYTMYRSKLPKDVTRNDNVTMHADVVGGYVVIYQTDSVRSNFDETTISITSKK
jgi:hypothetical protein